MCYSALNFSELNDLCFSNMFFQIIHIAARLQILKVTSYVLKISGSNDKKIWIEKSRFMVSLKVQVQICDE